MLESVTEPGLACDRILIIRWSWLDHGAGRSFDIGAAGYGIFDLPASVWSFLGVTYASELRPYFSIKTTLSVQHSILEV